MTTLSKDDIVPVERDIRTLARTIKNVKFRMLRALLKNFDEESWYVESLLGEILLQQNLFAAVVHWPICYEKDEPDDPGLIYFGLLSYRGSADDAHARWIISLNDMVDDMIWGQRSGEDDCDEKIAIDEAGQLIKLRDYLRALAQHIDDHIDYSSASETLE